jgi:2-polyprenyl-3-methyl-5-hydroxy-6-metoxy-1,4-benzoquinol methylase
MMSNDQTQQASLTDEAYWDERWGTVQLPALVDEGIRWQLAMAQVFRRFLPHDPSRSVFEIGCAPGRWLVWFHRTFGYTAYGCDLSKAAAETTRRNFATTDVPGEVFTGDVTKPGELPARQFDVVVSLGVIEHFADPEPVLRRHVDFTKPGGLVIVNVPNLAGSVNHWMLRRAKMQSLIDVHNLESMQADRFRAMADRLQLEVCFIEYVGGFDPGLVVYNHSYQSRWKRPVTFHALWALEKLTRRFPGVALGLNHPSFSNMLVGVFRRPSQTAGSALSLRPGEPS